MYGFLELAFLLSFHFIYILERAQSDLEGQASLLFKPPFLSADIALLHRRKIRSNINSRFF